MKRLIIFSSAILFIVLIILYNIGLYPFFVEENFTTRDTPLHDENKPFQQFDFMQGGYTAYVVIGFSDQTNLWPGFPHTRVLKSSDTQVLNQLRSCEFSNTGNDSLTIESHLYILKNDSLVYKSGVVLDTEYEGIQYESMGWSESKRKGQLAKIISQFKKELSPIVFLK